MSADPLAPPDLPVGMPARQQNGAVASPFGSAVEALDDASSAAWIRGVVSPTLGTVTAVIPVGYASYLRVQRPTEPSEDAWLFDLLAAVGAAWTTTPDLVTFAIWKGWGFECAVAHTAYEARVVLTGCDAGSEGVGRGMHRWFTRYARSSSGYQSSNYPSGPTTS
jgi:hypothetical protein